MQNVIISSEDIFQRLKSRLTIRNDSALARLLGVEPKKLAVWKLRNTVPYEVLISFCSQSGIDLNWLLTGIEPDTPRQAAEVKPDRYTEKILLMLGDMTDEQKEKVRIYAEDQKRLNDCLVELAGKGEKKRRGAA